MLALKRVYENAAPEDGVRFLVEKLWPRGIKKTDLKMDAWLKGVAPSDALRRWFAHDPKKWPGSAGAISGSSIAIRKLGSRFVPRRDTAASPWSTARTTQNTTMPSH